MMDMAKRVKVAMMDYIADLTGAGASQAELKIAIEMSKIVTDAMRSEQSEYTFNSPYFSIRRKAEDILDKMRDMIDHQGYVTIEYLISLSGAKTSPYTIPLYECYGWDNLGSAYIKSDSGNKLYYIVLPGVKKLV